MSYNTNATHGSWIDAQPSQFQNALLFKNKNKKKSIIKSGVEFVNTFSFAMIFYNSVNNDTC